MWKPLRAEVKIYLHVVVLIPQRRDALTNSIMKGIAGLKKWLAHPSPLPLSRTHAQRECVVLY